MKVLAMIINQSIDRNATHLTMPINKTEIVPKIVEDTIGKKTVLKYKMNKIT